jgi:hypothetical protein
LRYCRPYAQAPAALHSLPDPLTTRSRDTALVQRPGNAAQTPNARILAMTGDRLEDGLVADQHSRVAELAPHSGSLGSQIAWTTQLLIAGLGGREGSLRNAG